MTNPSPSATTRDPARLLTTLVAQLERDRRAFLQGSAIVVAANLVLAGLVWGREAGGAAAWLPAAIAFLANVFHALTAEWELRWEGIWRREIPRLEREMGEPLLGPVLQHPAPRRLALGLKWTSWALTVAWLIVLLLALRGSGIDFWAAP